MGWASLTLFLGIQVASADRDLKAMERRTLELAKESALCEAKQQVSQGFAEPLLRDLGLPLHDVNKDKVNQAMLAAVDRVLGKLTPEGIHAPTAVLQTVQSSAPGSTDGDGHKVGSEEAASSAPSARMV